MAPARSSPRSFRSSLSSLCPHSPFSKALQISPPRLPAHVCFHWPGLLLCLPGPGSTLSSPRKVRGGVPPVPQLATSRRWWSLYPVMLLKTPIRREGCGLETTKRELLYFVRSEWTQPGQALLWASFLTPTKPQGAVSTPAQPLGVTEAGPLRITEKGFPWPWRQIGRSLRDLPSQRKQVFASSWHQGRQEVVGALVGPRAGSRPSPCPSLAVPSGCWFPADAKDAHSRAHMGLPVWYPWREGDGDVAGPTGDVTAGPCADLPCSS